MPQEINRVTSVRRITSPDDVDTYVDLKIIDEITFIDPASHYQQTTIAFDNTSAASRVVTVVTVKGSDGSSTVDVERVTGLNVLDKSDHGQLTSYTIDNSAEPPIHLQTHLVTVRNKTNPGIWLQVQRIDAIAFKDPADHGQETVYTLNNLDDDADLDEPTTTWDGSQINPPWRIDPFQNIVDVCWGTATKLPAGSFLQTASWLPANCYQMTWSFWFNQTAIASNADTFAALESVLGDYAEKVFYWNNALFACAPDFAQNTDGVVIGSNVTGGAAASDFGVAITSGFKQWWGDNGDPTQNRPNSNGYNAGDIEDWLIFRSTSGVAPAGKWHHALISIDTNGGTAPYAAGGAFNGIGKPTTKKCVLFIDGANAIDLATIDDNNYFGDKNVGAFPWRAIMQGKPVGVPITNPATIREQFNAWRGAGGGQYRAGQPIASYSGEAPVEASFNFTSSLPPSAPSVSFFEYQVWTNLFVDPTVTPSLMDFFVDAVTDDKGVTTISPAALNTAAKSSYKAQNLPEKQWLSKAAAPCYYGKPALYLSGGQKDFPNNRGSGGAVTLSGEAVSTGGPSGVPKRA